MVREREPLRGRSSYPSDEPPTPPSFSESDADDSSSTEVLYPRLPLSRSGSKTSDPRSHDEEFYDSSPPNPPTTPLFIMAETTVMSSLNEASKIPKLNGPDDWVPWNRKLKGHLGMVNMYKMLTGEDPEPVTAEDASLTRWKLNQDRLSSLLILITGPSALSLLELDSTKMRHSSTRY